MTLLTTILGKKVVSKADAEDQGKIHDLTVDVTKKAVIAWQVGKGRHATFTDQVHMTGIGDAAAILDDAANLRPAEGPLEEAVAKGHQSLLGALVLTEAGDAIGKVTDADIDINYGALLMVRTDSVEIDAARLLGFGSYALVVAVPS